MKDDLISRQVAIDALEKVAALFPWKVPGNRDSYDRYNEAWNDAIGRAEIEIEELPSVQPESCKDALDDAYAHGCNTTMEHIGQLRKIKGGESVEVKVGKIRDAEKRYGLGRTKLREIAADAGAVVRIGRAYRIDFGVMDQYMDDLRQRAER